MKRLRAAECSGRRLICDAHDVVLRLLGGQSHTGRLRMETHHQRAWILCAITILHMAGPDATRCAQLGNLLEEVVVDVPEERQTGRERVNVQAPCDSAFNVGETISKCKRELLRRCSTRFANMVAADRNRIPLRHVLGGPLETIHYKSKRGLDRINPRMLRHVLLQNVVLYGASQLLRIDTLLLGSSYVEAIENDRRSVDGHGCGDLIERNAVEQNFHVRKARDGDAALADFSLRARMVGVVTHQGREIERDRESCLSMIQ